MKRAFGVLTVLVGLSWLVQQVQAPAVDGQAAPYAEEMSVAATAVQPWLLLVAGGVAAGLLIAAARRHVLVQTGIVGAALIAGAAFVSSDAVPSSMAAKPWAAFGLVVGGALLVIAAGFGLHRLKSSSGSVRWLAWRNRRNQGVASFWAILTTASAFAVRRRARTLLPSLRAMNWFRRGAVPIRSFATPLARVGLLRVWSPVEDVTVRVGGPRTGKSGELAGRILDAPGAVIATSTRTDLIDLTAGLRGRLGPVHVFNPAGVGGLASSITFDPLAGCVNPVTAATRAADLLAGASSPGSEGGDREFWASQARRVLATFLHAAALADAGLRDVVRWLTNPNATAGEVRKVLLRSSEPAFELDAMQFAETNERTQSSIASTIMPALGWLTDATAVAASTGGAGFDVAALLADRGTVYMLGAEDARTAPLVTALTGHIAREARRIASGMPGGRLDPPLTLVLDEAALICPVPLDEWTADMGGRNVTIHIAVQSRAQLRAKWGDTGAAAILNNTAALLVYGGTKDTDDLNTYSTLTGERYERVPTWDADGNARTHTQQRVPVLSPAQISQLKFGRVLILRRGMAPAIGRTRMAWTRTDVRLHRAALRWSARAARTVAAGRRFAGWAVRTWDAAVTALRPVTTAAQIRYGMWRSRRTDRRAGAGQPAMQPRALEPATSEPTTPAGAVRGGDPR